MYMRPCSRCAQRWPPGSGTRHRSVGPLALFPCGRSAAGYPPPASADVLVIFSSAGKLARLFDVDVLATDPLSARLWRTTFATEDAVLHPARYRLPLDPCGWIV